MQSSAPSTGGDTDDWSKIHDKALRKTVQNRLAQRKRRLKLAASKPLSNRGRIESDRRSAHGADDEASSQFRSNYLDTQRTRLLSQNENSFQELEDSTVPHHQILGSLQDSSCFSPFRNKPATSTSFSNYITSALGSALVEHRFIHLTQYSVFRAYLANASLLSLAPQLFLDDDALSPYTLFNPFPATTRPQLHTLSPTDLQLSTFHHPYIDLIASPSFRNNVLSTVVDEDQEEMLCMDLHFNGFTVWGSQPWNPMGWEVSQEFASKWGWLLDQDTIQHSNFWRAERGEFPLQLEEVGLV